jgi:hypothetical protein
VRLIKISCICVLSAYISCVTWAEDSAKPQDKQKNEVKLTAVGCKRICFMGITKILSGEEKESFNNCAGKGLCIPRNVVETADVPNIDGVNMR